MKIDSASAFPRQCFCRGSQDFILRAWLFTSAKTSARRRLVTLLPLLHISQTIRRIIYRRIIVVQILLYKFCYIQCNVLFSHVNNCVLKIISDASFEFKSKGKYKRKMLNRLKRNFKRKFYINSFCFMSQVLFFFGAGRWTDGKRMKQNKSCSKMWRYRISPIQWYKTWRQRLFYCHGNEKKRRNKLSKIVIDLTSCSTYRHLQVISLICKQ